MANPKGNESTLVKFTNKWNSGATKTIRVPVAIAEQVLEYARKLDELQPEDRETTERILTQLIIDLKSQVATKKSEVEQLKRKIAEIKTLAKIQP
jgi:predicted RNase H-like nuclease (RuvC/YqgF family)